MRRQRFLSSHALVFFLFSFFFLFPSLSWAHEEDLTSNLTTQLLRGSRDYQKAKGIEKRKALLEKLKGLALERQGRLLKEMEKEPGMFLLHAFPKEVRGNLPSEIRPLIEEHLQLRGELTVLRVDDFEKKISQVFYHLTTEDASPKTYTLHFAKDPPQLLSGSKILAKGVRLDSSLVLAQGGSTGTQTSSAGKSSTTGDQKTVVLLANFQDKTLECTNSDVASVMFTGAKSVDKFFRDASFNQTSFSGAVFGPYPIPYSSATSWCDYAAWSTALENAAANAGVSLNNYSRRVYVFPLHSNCYGAQGTVGGKPSKSWLCGFCSYPDVYSHELGHNLGVGHASTPADEYGDASCIMGYRYGLRHFNTPHKVEMGWIPASRVQSVTATGTYTYTVSLSEQTDGLAIQAVKIPKPDLSGYYYFSYRRPLGFDEGLALVFRDKTSVHRWSGVPSDKTFLLAALADGESFTDAANGITVTQQSHDAATATLAITSKGPQCVIAPPYFSASLLTQAGGAGQPMTFTLYVNNADTSVCSSTTFALNGTVPAGWTSSFSPQTLQVAPAATGSSVWTVTPPPGTPDGSYSLTAQVVDVNDANHGNSFNLTSIIYTDITAPAVSITSPADGSLIPRSGSVQIQVSATDDQRVAKVEVRIDGILKAALTTAPYNYTWSAKSAVKGPHNIEAKAYDGAGNTASASITVYK